MFVDLAFCVFDDTPLANSHIFKIAPLHVSSVLRLSTPHCQLKNLGVIDRAKILQHLVSRVKVKYKERYAKVLDLTDLETILEGSLSPAVREICENGNFTLSRYAIKTWNIKWILIFCSKLGRDRRQPWNLKRYWNLPAHSLATELARLFLVVCRSSHSTLRANHCPQQPLSSKTPAFTTLYNLGFQGGD